MSDTKKPELRFEGFNDDWEQRKLGELCERVTRKNITGESDLPLTIASQYGLIDQRDFFNKVVAAKDMSNYYLLKKGEFAYNKSYSNGYDFGSIKRLNAYEQGCLSTLYICFGITSDDIESDYLECFFDTLKWYSDITMICAEGARNHGLLNVDTKAFFDEVTIEMPSSKEEQRKISSYLNNLDNLITLHQRKYEKLLVIKKSMLGKMFPKAGEKVPEIRFAGFTDDWEQRKLGEMGSTFTGLSGKTKDDFGHGEAQFVTYMNVYTNPVADLNMTEKVEVDPRQQSVKYGDIFFTTSSETPDEVGMSSVWLGDAGNTYLNSFCFGYRPEKKIDPYYMAFMLRSAAVRKKLIYLAQGISRYNISKNRAMNIEILLPGLDEQKKIGEYFKSLDHLITLHQREVNKLKNLKKSLLGKMFI